MTVTPALVPRTLRPSPDDLAGWEADPPVFRHRLGISAVLPGDAQHRGRFNPFVPLGAASDPLPVLYGASEEDGALSETVFHDVPVRGAKQISYRYLQHRVLVALTSRRDLMLVDLTTHGLGQLGLVHSELIEPRKPFCPATAQWARALHAHLATVDGLTRVSHQDNTSWAIVLFGGRVGVDDLVVVLGRVPMTVGAGAGFALALDIADRAGITITEVDG